LVTGLGSCAKPPNYRFDRTASSYQSSVLEHGARRRSSPAVAGGARDHGGARCRCFRAREALCTTLVPPKHAATVGACGEQRQRRACKRGPAPQIQQKIERLTRLPKTQQKVVMQMLDGVLAQASR